MQSIEKDVTIRDEQLKQAISVSKSVGFQLSELKTELETMKKEGFGGGFGSP